MAAMTTAWFQKSPESPCLLGVERQRETSRIVAQVLREASYHDNHDEYFLGGRERNLR